MIRIHYQIKKNSDFLEKILLDFGVENIIQFYTLMERTNLWSSIDFFEPHLKLHLKLWQKG